MKWLALTFLVLAVASWDANYIGCYSMGAMGKVWLILNPFFLGPLLLLSLVVWLALSLSLLFRRSTRTWGFGIFIAFIVIVVVHRTLPPAGIMNAYGIRDRMMKVATLDDLRRMALELHENDVMVFHGDPTQRSTPEGREVFQTDVMIQKERKDFQALQQKYPILSWGMGREDGPSIFERDNSVDVCWGGALSGHWGVSIGLLGQKNEPYPEALAFPAATDIYFFAGE